MPRTLPLRTAPLLLLLFALAGTGCVATGYGMDRRPADRVVVRAPGPPPAPVRSARLYHRADADAARYARELRRHVGLTARQERAVANLLADRTHVLLDRTSPRDHAYVYPFPRRINERDRLVQRWWRDSDRALDRVLDRQQRRRYQDYLRAARQETGRRGAVRPAHPHGGPPGQRRGH